MVKRPDKVTLSIPPDLKRKAKAKAALEGKSLSAVVTELLEEWVKRGLTIIEGEQSEQSE
jgi:predicted HicB family RNase H-like nuclease